MTAEVAVLAVAWGLCCSAPLVRRARRVEVGVRSRSLGGAPRSSRAFVGVTGYLRRLRPIGVTATVLVRWTRMRSDRRREAVVGRELPTLVDLLAVAIGSGSTPFLAVGQVAAWAPPVTGRALARVRDACELGSGFAPALEAEATTTPRLRGLVDALLAGDRHGAPVGEALARLAAEERATVRRDAESRARRVPVRLLFPLVFLVLPAFGLLTVAPVLLTGFART